MSRADFEITPVWNRERRAYLCPLCSHADILFFESKHHIAKCVKKVAAKIEESCSYPKPEIR